MRPRGLRSSGCDLALQFQSAKQMSADGYDDGRQAAVSGIAGEPVCEFDCLTQGFTPSARQPSCAKTRLIRTVGVSFERKADSPSC